MYAENFITPCDACYVYRLPACPPDDENIVLKASLGNAQSRVWYVEDKFGKVTSGTGTTTAGGDLAIPVSEFPEGYFTEHSGQFTIYVKSTTTSATVLDLTFGGTTYECVRVNFIDSGVEDWNIQ